MAMLIITAMIMVIILTSLGGWGSHLNSTYSFLGKYGGLGKIVNIDGCIYKQIRHFLDQNIFMRGANH